MAMRPRPSGIRPLPPPPQLRGPVYEDFQPMSEWKRERESDILVIFLPGFVKEQVKVTTEPSGAIKVRGERALGNYKWSRFNQDYRIPDNCNVNAIRARFEGGILTITMPQKTVSVRPKLPPPPPPPPQVASPRQPLPPPDPAIISAVKNSATSVIKSKESDQKEEEIRSSIAKDQKATLASDSDKKTDQKEENIRSSTKAKDQTVATDSKQLDSVAAEKDQGKKKESDIERISKESKSDEKVMENKMITSEKGINKERIDYVSGGDGIKDKGKESLEDEKKKVTGKSSDNVGGSGGKDELDNDGIKEKRRESFEDELETYKKMAEGLTKKLSEERKLLVNVGVAVLVIVALGAHISYTIWSSSGEPKN